MHQPAQCRTDGCIGFRVYTGGRVIQQQDRRILQQRTCDSHPLLLPAGKGHAALAYQRVVPFGESLNHVMDCRRPGRGLHLFIGDISYQTIGDIVADRRRKQERLLLHNADLAAQKTARIVPQFFAVQNDVAAAVVIETR